MTDLVAVAIPVRNEVERLPALLAALAEQRGAPLFSLCLFFDGCHDGSAALVEALAATLPYPIHSQRCAPGRPPNAGIARGRAMALAAGVACDGTLLSTDADGQPAADWIAANLAALNGADVVAGRIVRDAGPPSPRQDRMEAYLGRLHALRRQLDPVPWEASATHHWTSAASLAMRARTYRTLGGFAPVAHGEDAQLCDEATRAGLRVRRDVSVVVRTSARRHGRAREGFAAALCALDRAHQPPSVFHPSDEAWRFRRQAEARRLHGTADYRHFAQVLGLALAEVEQVAGECRNGEAFAARIVGDPAGGMRRLSLDQAEMHLAGLAAADLVEAA